MIQRLPPESGTALQALTEEQEEGWRKAVVLMSSSTSAELVDPKLSPNDLLFRLFHEDGVRVFGSTPLSAFCRCSQERIESVLTSFSPDERADMIEDDGVIRVTCEYCSKVYAVAPDALERAEA